MIGRHSTLDVVVWFVWSLSAFESLMGLVWLVYLETVGVGVGARVGVEGEGEGEEREHSM